MVVCIDTNVMLPVLSLRNPWGRILDQWIEGRFQWAVSNEIMSEYEEIIRPRLGDRRWQDFLSLLDLGAELNGNLLRMQPDFRFGVVQADPDDNKFTDCAITANADWIVTQDKHFQAMKGSGYRPQPILPEAFLRVLQ